MAIIVSNRAVTYTSGAMFYSLKPQYTALAPDSSSKSQDITLANRTLFKIVDC